MGCTGTNVIDIPPKITKEDMIERKELKIESLNQFQIIDKLKSLKEIKLKDDQDKLNKIKMDIDKSKETINDIPWKRKRALKKMKN